MKVTLTSSASSKAIYISTPDIVTWTPRDKMSLKTGILGGIFSTCAQWHGDHSHLIVWFNNLLWMLKWVDEFKNIWNYRMTAKWDRVVQPKGWILKTSFWKKISSTIKIFKQEKARNKRIGGWWPVRRDTAGILSVYSCWNLSSHFRTGPKAQTVMWRYEKLWLNCAREANIWLQNSGPCHISGKSLMWSLENLYNFNFYPTNSPDCNHVDYYV